MQLCEEQIKQAILHPEPPVRKLALDYFSQSFSQDKTVMPLVIEAMKSLDERELFHFAFEAVQLPQTESTIQWCMEQLDQELIEQEIVGPLLHYTIPLSRLLVSAELPLIQDKESEILKLPALHPEAVHVLSERLELLSESPESLWNKLTDFCERENAKKYISEMDTPHAYRIVEALVRSDADIADRVLEMLNEEVDVSTNNPRELMQGFVFRLAGELRLTVAVPWLIKAVKENNDWYHELGTKALAQIGGNDVLEAVAEEFPTADWTFKLYSAGVLEKIHTENCIKKCMELFNKEKNQEIKTILGRAALAHFSSEAIEPVRQHILESEHDPEIEDLREVLISISTLFEIDFSEFADWKKQCEENRLRFERQINEMDKICFQASDDDEDDSSEEEPVHQNECDYLDDGEYIEPSYPQETIVRQGAKIGRNEPCPCSSGKKYKKCCMNKTNEASILD